MRKNRDYFNFPIQMLEGFLVDSHAVLTDIPAYSVYAYSLKIKPDDPKLSFKKAAKEYGISRRNFEKFFKDGESLYASYPSNSPKVGIYKGIYWDYYENHKTEFEKVCLLGFLAIKSIVQDKAYCKITNKFWLSRMHGKASCVKSHDYLSAEIKKYHNEYQTRKIKLELELSWGLISYSRYTRGFYVSFKLDLDKLTYHAENNRKSTKEKQQKFAKKLALEKALARLNENIIS